MAWKYVIMILFISTLVATEDEATTTTTTTTMTTTEAPTAKDSLPAEANDDAVITEAADPHLDDPSSNSSSHHHHDTGAFHNDRPISNNHYHDFPNVNPYVYGVIGDKGPPTYGPPAGTHFFYEPAKDGEKAEDGSNLGKEDIEYFRNSLGGYRGTVGGY